MATVIMSTKKESLKICANTTTNKIHDKKTLHLVLSKFNLTSGINDKISIMVEKTKQ